MNKIIATCIALTALISCGSEEPRSIPQRVDVEMALINDILPLILPEKPLCMPVPIKGESSKDYEIRLQEFYDEVDSLEKKIEVFDCLAKLDSQFVIHYPELLDSSIIVRHLLNAPYQDRLITLSDFDSVQNLEIIVIKERQAPTGQLTDCYTVGELQLSRVGFNADSTRAAFRYLIYTGSSTEVIGGIVDAEFEHGAWTLIRK